MCMPKQVCSAFHVLWSLVYVGVGSVQLVAGIFFFISLPVFRIGSNIWTGAWNIVIGIGAGMLSCVGDLNYKRQEALLFLAISILAINVVNVVLLEVGEWHFFLNDTTKEIISQKNSRILVFYAHITTSVSTAVAIVISFFDIQFTYCSMQRSREAKNVHEQVSDIEYIIPRKKSNTVAKQAHNIYSQYAQSWVFDTDTTGSSKNDSPYLKLPNVSPNDVSKTATIRTPKSAVVEVNSDSGQDPNMFLVNPVVHVETVSDDNERGRTLNYMKSFSRTPSPVVLSESSSPDSSANNPPIYECLERLTEPALYRSRLNTAISLNAEHTTGSSAADEHEQPSTSRERRPRPRSETFTKDRLSVAENLDVVEKVQYASLLVELQQALRSKKERHAQPGSPQSACDSTTVEDVSDKTRSASKASSPRESSQEDSRKTDKKSSDAEFSKELEAALQLIQDLESPNTIDTPSETCRSLEGIEVVPAVICVKWRDSSDASESTKTLSECASPVVDLPEESRQQPQQQQQQQHGKTTSIVVVAPSGSESSSGYSSPSPGTSKRPTPICSNPPSVNGSADNLTDEQQVAFAIQNTGTGAIISLFSPSGDRAAGKDAASPPPMRVHVKLSEANSDTLKSSSKASGTLDTSSPGSSTTSTLRMTQSPQSTLSSSGSSRWNVKSLLKRKPSQLTALPPELEGAIIKSESLAYLTELELLARHARNKSIQRQIEKRVQQQILGLSPSESNC